jgi:hypothetical protein
VNVDTNLLGVQLLCVISLFPEHLQRMPLLAMHQRAMLAKDSTGKHIHQSKS